MKKISFVMVVMMLCSIMTVNGIEPYTSAPGKSAIVMEVETGRVLFEKNSHEKMPTASTTKIMTALLAIENVDPEKVVKIPPEAVGIEGSSIYLRANETVKMVDLLYGLMLRSGNDAATAIAIEVAGSVEEFASLMTQRARELGAENTSFMNPHGLHHDLHYTTAYDLALITQAAMKESLFKKIVGTKFHTAESRDAEFKYFANKNKILKTTEGGDGVKTGYTKKSGRCLVASATRNDMQLIAISLNDYDYFNTTRKLLDDSFAIFKPHQILQEGDVMATISVTEGKVDTLDLLARDKVVIPVSDEEVDKIKTVVEAPDAVMAPVDQGAIIGKVHTYLDGELINTTELLAAVSIQKLTFKDKFLRFLRIK
ncbi:D-alanyl-D-alanine carboxypeptidase family protein [Alkaliphilus hydrothermalis]|uniref:serine-type D-Ala-D-Ala carboxypeptidase n=1 Tax=Alkaliphilus hydrothermalis TaxID=1482730 RepID=A0ABS2NM77_9FIRM|nr:D-alanyl-D-alanine carboxypeptidase family protein [Alkaliphilus hydrothermalis]MBM7614060.1 D-alanyl-D-alanine carboxypeptidase (penicillin-binding protein 5/6) [Alkaliphilus hydrothermalis]